MGERIEDFDLEQDQIQLPKEVDIKEEQEKQLFASEELLILKTVVRNLSTQTSAFDENSLIILQVFLKKAILLGEFEYVEQIIALKQQNNNYIFDYIDEEYRLIIEIISLLHFDQSKLFNHLQLLQDCSNKNLVCYVISKLLANHFPSDVLFYKLKEEFVLFFETRKWEEVTLEQLLTFLACKPKFSVKISKLVQHFIGLEFEKWNQSKDEQIKMNIVTLTEYLKQDTSESYLAQLFDSIVQMETLITLGGNIAAKKARVEEFWKCELINYPSNPYTDLTKAIYYYLMVILSYAGEVLKKQTDFLVTSNYAAKSVQYFLSIERYSNAVFDFIHFHYLCSFIEAVSNLPISTNCFYTIKLLIHRVEIMYKALVFKKYQPFTFWKRFIVPKLSTIAWVHSSPLFKQEEKINAFQKYSHLLQTNFDWTYYWIDLDFFEFQRSVKANIGASTRCVEEKIRTAKGVYYKEVSQTEQLRALNNLK